MKRIATGVMVCFLFLAIAATVSASMAQFLGTWTNTNPKTSGLTKLIISNPGGQIMVHAWGQCQPQDCDWGNMPGFAYGPNVSAKLDAQAEGITVVHKESFAERLLIIQRAEGNRLRVANYTRFTDKSGRTNYVDVETFARVPAVTAPKEDCIPFNFNQVQAQNVGGRWKVVQGSMWMLDFASHQDQAERAVQIMKHYKLDRQCFVGRPDPSMQYYTTQGRAPEGSLPGEDCLSFNLNNVQVQNVGGRWKIVDGSHWILDFEKNEAEARTAFAIMKYYGFRQICFVGRPNPPMTYFKK